MRFDEGPPREKKQRKIWRRRVNDLLAKEPRIRGGVQTIMEADARPIDRAALKAVLPRPRRHKGRKSKV